MVFIQFQTSQMEHFQAFCYHINLVQEYQSSFSSLVTCIFTPYYRYLYLNQVLPECECFSSFFRTVLPWSWNINCAIKICFRSNTHWDTWMLNNLIIWIRQYDLLPLKVVHIIEVLALKFYSYHGVFLNPFYKED